MSCAVLRCLVVVPALLALACLGPAPERQAERAAAPSPAATPATSPASTATPPAEPASTPTPTPAPMPSPVGEPAPAPEVGTNATTSAAAPEPAPEPEPSATTDAEPTPESDAELLALLDDSTLTQDEFAKAFGTAKAPKIDAEGEFQLGAVERSRVEVGAATARAGKPDLAGVEALAKADVHELEACHAMALRKDDKALGKLVLELAFDAAGKVESVTVTSKLPKALTDCVASVAKAWSSTKSANTELELALTLALQPM